MMAVNGGRSVNKAHVHTKRVSSDPFCSRKLAYAYFECKKSHKYQIPVAVPFSAEMPIYILARLGNRFSPLPKSLFPLFLIQRVLPDSKLEIINDGS